MCQRYQENELVVTTVFPFNKIWIIYQTTSTSHVDVIYDQPNISNMSDKTESLQYNAALEIIDAIRGTSKEIFYQELELESLRNRRGFRRMSYWYKIISTKSPPYSNELILPL